MARDRSAPTARAAALAYEQRALLGLCARATPHPEQLARVASAARALTSWDGFVERAETDGLGPLAYQHLSQSGVALPEPVKRGLIGLHLRHRRTNALFAGALRETLDAFEVAHIGTLLLKGAALSQMVYPEPGLRPMRDVDLLLRPSAIAHARAVLGELGFAEDPASARAVSADHYHAPSMTKRLSGLTFGIELHTRLGIRDTRVCRMQYDELEPRAQRFELRGRSANTLGMHDMLWLVYRHGFGLSVRSEAYRLIWLADLVSIVDAWAPRLDWRALEAEYPLLVRALPWLHFVTPWSAETLSHVPWQVPKAPSRVGEDFSGWPRIRMRARGERSAAELLRETVFPSPWWLALRHGAKPSALGFARAWTTHLRDLW